MATMLVYILTDARIDPQVLQKTLLKDGDDVQLSVPIIGG